MEKINHSRCKYHYRGDVSVSKTTYSALRNHDVEISGVVKAECCGLEPMAFVLDDNQPLCRFYRRKKIGKV